MGFKRKRLPAKKYKELCEKVYERDNFMCRHPECINPTWMPQFHHIIFRSRGGEDSMENLITLCQTHHERCHLRGGKLWIVGDANSAEFVKVNPKLC